LFFAFIIAEQNWASRSLLKMSRLKLCSFLGRYTYGLYLLHPLALLLAGALLGLPLVGAEVVDPTVICGFVGLILSLALSMASYHLLELPFLRIKQRFAVVPSATP